MNIPRMAASNKNVEAGSVGAVETRFLDLPAPLPLDCGRELSPIRIAYETYGKLSPKRDNVILVCHALSGDAHAAGYSSAPGAAATRDGFRADERDAGKGAALGWWDGMIGPGKAFDTTEFFVVSTNLLGGCRGRLDLYLHSCLLLLFFVCGTLGLTLCVPWYGLRKTNLR